MRGLYCHIKIYCRIFELFNDALVKDGALYRAKCNNNRFAERVRKLLVLYEEAG